jgi:hypothetical protein
MKLFIFFSKILGVLFIIPVCVGFAQLQSDNSIGGLAGAPLRMGFGARGIGMGNAMSAVITGDLSPYYNPALTPFQTAPEAMAAYGILSLDRNLNYVSYGQSLKPHAGISFAIINSGVGNIDGRDYDGNHTNTYATSENAFLFSFGIQVIPQLSLGLSAKFFYYSLYSQMSSTTAGVDLGAVYLVTDELTIAGVIQDINAKYKWDSSKLYGTAGSSFSDNFPVRKRIAASYNFKQWDILSDAELEWIGSAPFARIGAEIGLYQGVALRSGIDQIDLSGDGISAKPSFGISVATSVGSWTPAFHYAYVIEPLSPSNMHFISLSVRFK